MTTIRMPEIARTGFYEHVDSCFGCVHDNKGAGFCNVDNGSQNNFGDKCGDRHTITVENTDEGYDKYAADKARYKMGLIPEDYKDEY